MLAEKRVFFSGDTGYFDGFKSIGKQYGPFDLAMLETGAYDLNWPGVHMQPEETMQACIDLKSQNLLPIHNGTFDLSMHTWQEPFERIVALGKARSIPVMVPQMGEQADMAGMYGEKYWWTGVDKCHAAGQTANGFQFLRLQDDLAAIHGFIRFLFFRHQCRKSGPGTFGNARPRVQAPSLPGCQGRNFAIRTPHRTPHMASR